MARFREIKLSTVENRRADERRMVRVNGEESRATVRNIGTDIHDGSVRLYIQLTAPLDESSKWIIGSRVALEAAWGVGDIIIPAHEGLSEVIEQQFVRGEFLVRSLHLSEGWFFVELVRSGAESHCKADKKLDSKPTTDG